MYIYIYISIYIYIYIYIIYIERKRRYTFCCCCQMFILFLQHPRSSVSLSIGLCFLILILVLGSLRWAGIVLLFPGPSFCGWSVLYCKYPVKELKQKALLGLSFVFLRSKAGRPSILVFGDSKKSLILLELKITLTCSVVTVGKRSSRLQVENFYLNALSSYPPLCNLVFSSPSQAVLGRKLLSGL